MPSGWPVFNVGLKIWFLLLWFQKVQVKTIFPSLSSFLKFLLYDKWRLFSFWSFLSTGRYDVNFCIFHCKDCKNVFSPLDSSNLIQAGYWPGSISNTKYVFSQDLFFKWDLLQKRLPGSSESGFLRSLEDFSVIRGRVSSFYNAYWISNG